MLIWNFFDFSKWSLEKLEAASGQKAEASHLQAQRTFLAGRIALRHLLQTQNLSLEIVPNRKLGFLELENSFGSIAHTDEVSVSVISSFPVGIDIENCQRKVGHVLPKIASQEEIKRIDSFQNEIQTQVEDKGLFLWTAKEAFSKASGIGLREGIQDLKVHLTGTEPYRGESSLHTPFKLTTPTLSFHLVGNYLVSICFEGTLGSVAKHPRPYPLPPH
jgi:phosphopantetheinyl transferase